ncbi:DUF305 domain-containing protein [Amaricoccus macauensis]|uniref:DUF305 domain-containing protein n=1 Tax=Amaricoccus macauensis TaxID=57001 RepID=UPI003C7CDDDD
MKYSRFFAMIATSTIVMFGLMYLNTYLISHIFWSETRAYMAVVMGAAMALIMLVFMLSMYRNRMLNIAILAGSVAIFAGALWLVRSQVTVQDRNYMRAMIPHHSIAIMTSTRAQLTDPRVRALADDIIYAQDKEIAEMRFLIADIGKNGEAQEAAEPAAARLVSAEEALASEVVTNVDPEFLSEDEIAELFPNGGVCRFTYTKDSPAVFVTGEDAEGPAGLVKISGDLVRISGDGRDFVTGRLSIQVRGTDDNDLTDMLVSAGANYHAGFRGKFSCPIQG